jgi:signal peptidase I
MKPRPELLALLLLVGCATAQPQARPLPRSFIGTGQSMEPLYGQGTVVFTNTKSFDEVKVGDIVVYHSSRGFNVCHEVVGKSWRGFIMRGLNNTKWDEEYMTRANFLGVVDHTSKP